MRHIPLHTCITPKNLDSAFMCNIGASCIPPKKGGGGGPSLLLFLGTLVMHREEQGSDPTSAAGACEARVSTKVQHSTNIPRNKAKWNGEFLLPLGGPLTCKVLIPLPFLLSLLPPFSPSRRSHLPPFPRQKKSPFQPFFFFFFFETSLDGLFLSFFLLDSFGPFLFQFPGPSFPHLSNFPVTYIFFVNLGKWPRVFSFICGGKRGRARTRSHFRYVRPSPLDPARTHKIWYLITISSFPLLPPEERAF